MLGVQQMRVKNVTDLWHNHGFLCALNLMPMCLNNQKLLIGIIGNKIITLPVSPNLFLTHFVEVLICLWEQWYDEYGFDGIGIKRFGEVKHFLVRSCSENNANILLVRKVVVLVLPKISSDPIVLRSLEATHKI